MKKDDHLIFEAFAQHQVENVKQDTTENTEDMSKWDRGNYIVDLQGNIIGEFLGNSDISELKIDNDVKHLNSGYAATINWGTHIGLWSRNKRHRLVLRNPDKWNEFFSGLDKKSENSEDEERRLDSSCWKGYHKQGTKMKGGVRVNNCVKNENEENDDEEGSLMSHMKEKGMISKSAGTSTGKYGHHREEEEGDLPSLYQFHKMLQQHDWTYQYSDDSRMYRRGQQQEDAIQSALKKGGQPYQDLYDKFVNQQKSGEKFETPQKDQAELEKDRAMLNDMKTAIEDVRDKMYHDIDENSVYHPQQLWDLYYPAINILHAIKEVAQTKGYKTLIKSLIANNIK